jgi:hypothetical protein
VVYVEGSMGLGNIMSVGENNVDNAELDVIRSSPAYARFQWGARTLVVAVIMGGVTAALVPFPIPHLFTALIGAYAFVGFIVGFLAMLSAAIPINRLTVPYVHGGNKYPDTHRRRLLISMIVKDLARLPGKPLASRPD